MTLTREHKILAKCRGLFIGVVLTAVVFGLAGCMSSSDVDYNTMKMNQDIEYNSRAGRSPYSDVDIPIGNLGYMRAPER